MGQRQAAFSPHLYQVAQAAFKAQKLAHAYDDEFAVKVAFLGLNRPQFSIRAHSTRMIEPARNQTPSDIRQRDRPVFASRQRRTVASTLGETRHGCADERS